MPSHARKWGLLLLAFLLPYAYGTPAQSLDPCDGRPDEEIFGYGEPSETSHGVDQGLVDLFHTLGHLLLFGWWLFAAGLLVLLVRILRRSIAAWFLMWLPLLLVLWIALPHLQELQQRLAELEQFRTLCRTYDPPSPAFLAYKQRQWDHAMPYIRMLVAMVPLYVGAIIYLVRFQRNPPVR